MSDDPSVVLDMLRGARTPNANGEYRCGCGRMLVPLIIDGKRYGVTHKTDEDEEWHMQFFGGMEIEVEEPTP